MGKTDPAQAMDLELVNEVENFRGVKGSPQHAGADGLGQLAKATCIAHGEAGPKKGFTRSKSSMERVASGVPGQPRVAREERSTGLPRSTGSWGGRVLSTLTRRISGGIVSPRSESTAAAAAAAGPNAPKTPTRAHSSIGARLASVFQGGSSRRSTSSSVPKGGDILGEACSKKRLDAVYELGGVIGRGQWGIVSECRHRESGELFACKTLLKERMDSQKARDDARREVEVMVKLRGHPNVVSIVDLFEDTTSMHIVMDLCSGGPLTDRIASQGEYGERAAAGILRVVLEVVHQCHTHGIVHRDLKLCNFLLSDPSDSATVKSIDFGTSCFLEDGERVKEMAGSPLYMAPEVLEEDYGKEADIWSCGVILHTLLTGRHPFTGASVLKIFDAIRSQPLDLESHPWPLVSGEAKELLRQMLQRDPSLRPSAAQLLEHPWVQGKGSAEMDSGALASIMLPRWKKLSSMCRLRQLSLLMTSQYLPEEKLAVLRGVFASVDADGSGKLSLTELEEAMKRVGAIMTTEEVQAAFEFVDLDGSGEIDCAEFVAATLVMKGGEHTAAIRRAFEEIDADNSGSIEIHEFVAVCSRNNMGDEQEILSLVEGALRDPETGAPATSIDYSSFLAIVMGEHQEAKDMSWALSVF